MLGFFQRLKSKKGFTLIELIVVIAILAILSAILVPTMMSIIGSAKKQVKESNAAAVFSAAQAAYVTITAVGVEDGDGPEEIAEGSYDSKDTTDQAGTFIKEIEKNLSPGTTVTERYIIQVGETGVSGVRYGDSDTVVYPEGASVATASEQG